MTVPSVAELEAADPETAEAIQAIRDELTQGVAASTAEALALDILYTHLDTFATREDAQALIVEIMNEHRSNLVVERDDAPLGYCPVDGMPADWAAAAGDDVACEACQWRGTVSDLASEPSLADDPHE